MDEINIEPEDLNDLPEPPLPAATEPGEMLVIESEDLVNLPPPPTPQTKESHSAHAPAAWAPASGAEAYPPAEPVGQYGGVSQPKGSLGLMQVAGWGLLHLALAGAIGGFLAWACAEPMTNDQDQGGDLVTMLLHMAGFGALLGGLIGAALGSVEGVSARVARKALQGAGLGLLIGGAGGALGGLFGQLLYGSWVGGGTSRGPFGLLGQIAIRAIAWGLVGVFIGLGQGAYGATPRKLLNGLLGGAIGGFAGGLLFDPISGVVQMLVPATGPHAGWLSRVVAMVVTGLCTGGAVGLVQELRKEAWLIVAAGPLVGKQFILYRPTTTLGSSPKADICLLKDPGILPLHASLQQSGAGHLLVTTPEAPVAVNGRLFARGHLRNGDMIGLGRTVLEYRLKAIQPEAPWER